MNTVGKKNTKAETNLLQDSTISSITSKNLQVQFDIKDSILGIPRGKNSLLNNLLQRTQICCSITNMNDNINVTYIQ